MFLEALQGDLHHGPSGDLRAGVARGRARLAEQKGQIGRRGSTGFKASRTTSTAAMPNSTKGAS